MRFCGKRAIWAALMLAATGSAADWPQFLGPTRNGASTEIGLLERMPPGGPSIVWRRAVGQGFAGPVVSDDALYLFHFQGGEEWVERLSVADGRTLWRVGYPSNYQGGMFRELGPRATPVVAHGRIITFGADGVLQCLECASGALIWRRKLHEEYAVRDSYFGAACSPAVEGDLVLLNLGGKEGAGLAAFDRNTGKTVWTATDDGASYSSPVTATLGGKRTALFFARTGLHGVDPRTGAERFFFRWRSRSDASVNAATPLVLGERIFVSSSYGVGATLLEVANEAVRPVWKSDETLVCHYNTCVAANGFLYGIDGRQEGGARLQCVEAATGKLRWTKEGTGCASIILADGKLWMFKEDGELLVVEANSAAYKPLGSAAVVTGVCRAHPALANGQLYVRGPEELVRINVLVKQ